jgi:cob(I)alamin adenosyltransferase
MKIYTKKGDKGQTGLIGGSRVSKNDLRINAYGTVDELNAHVGLLRDLVEGDELQLNLLEIQDRLFTAGSLLAVGEKGTKMKLPELHEENIQRLESWIDAMDKTLPEMKTFVLPGGHITVSTCHVARTVCRRAERLIVELSDQV